MGRLSFPLIHYCSFVVLDRNKKIFFYSIFNPVYIWHKNSLRIYCVINYRKLGKIFTREKLDVINILLECIPCKRGNTGL